MINVSDIKQYLYCPRSYYYIKHLGLSPINEHIAEGNQLHKRNENRHIKNLFFCDESLGLKGRIDYLTTKDKITLWELKKGNHRKLWLHHKIQALAYIYLAKRRNFRIDNTFVKYQNGEKFQVDFTKQDEENIKTTMKKMQNLKQLPPRCENTRKCNGCNLKEFCWT